MEVADTEEKVERKASMLEDGDEDDNDDDHQHCYCDRHHPLPPHTTTMITKIMNMSMTSKIPTTMTTMTKMTGHHR
jgi:hypothetical protein